MTRPLVVSSHYGAYAEAVHALAEFAGEAPGAASRLSYLGLVRLFGTFGASDRALPSHSRRWCPECWHEDGPEPYERKLWWLALVETCPVPECLLEHRCRACGRAQSSLTRAVRLKVCSFCGYELLTGAEPLRLHSDPTTDRLLWYAREGARLGHAAEAAALMAADQAKPLDAAYACLARVAAEKELPAVSQEIEDARFRTRPREAWLEELFSALWRLRLSVLELSSPTIREAVGYSL